VFKILLALHVLFAVGAIGPLIHAATTASRGVRHRDAVEMASAARMLKIYSYTSVLVIIVGFALMSTDSPFRKGQKVGEFSDLWIWLSLLLWLVAMALIFAVIVPSLTKATALVGTQQPPSALTARVAAVGSTVGLIFAVIVFLMVYRPGG
jgi:hypothetical protein